MKRILIALGMLLVASACAGPANRLRGSYDAAPGRMAMANASHDGNPRQASSTEIVCENEIVVGSHIPREVCYSVSVRESERGEIQNALERMPSPLPKMQ